MSKKELLYEGKAKKVYTTNNPEEVIIHYKDDATAFNAQKKGEIKDKGVVNNEVTSLIYSFLETQGIKTHLIKKLSDREQLCQKVSIYPLEFVTRNIVAGSMAQRLGIEEGYKPDIVIYDICYKKDELGDPLINDYHAVVLGAATFEELKIMYEMTEKINHILIQLFDEMNLILVDFKIEFGKNAAGEIVLADEITPDTCRLWDKDTMEKMDKDRFRRDLGNVEEAYAEILKRVSSKI